MSNLNVGLVESETKILLEALIEKKEKWPLFVSSQMTKMK
jgi:hypothetical protein